MPAVSVPVGSDSVSAASLLAVICTVSTEEPGTPASVTVASAAMAVAAPFSV